jgi:tellurite methyltransferase
MLAYFSMRAKNHTNTQPATWLIENATLLPRAGKALDIAMGIGRNSLFLANWGLEVEGIDISPEFVARAGEMAAEAGAHITAQVANLESGSYEVPPAGYDVIVCINYLHRPLIPQLKAGLIPGGFIVYETYLVDQAQWGLPSNPAHLLQHNELLDMFRDLRVLRYREGIFEGQKALASLVAKK